MLEMLKRAADPGSPVAKCTQGHGRAIRGPVGIASTNDGVLGFSPGQY